MGFNMLQRLRLKLRAGFEAVSQARTRTGKGPAAQAKELVRLRMGPTRLRAREYYVKQMYDDTLYPEEAKKETGGRLLQRRLWRLARNDSSWNALAKDKLIFYGFARGLNLPTPRVLAVYHPGWRTYGETPCLRSSADIKAFLRSCRSYPLFGKRVDDALGRGSTSIDSYDRSRDLLKLTNGDTVASETYIEDHVTPNTSGYIFQEKLETHPRLLRVCGPRLTVLRLNILTFEEGPRLFRAKWKVPTGSNIADNFRRGRAGNIVADVDRYTGEVSFVIRGTGEVYYRPGRAPGIVAEEVIRHPDTDEVLRGLIIPTWERAVAVALNAHAALPGFRWLGWDVALTARGPVLLECNHKPYLPQLPIGGPGVYDSEMKAFISRNSGK